MMKQFDVDELEHTQGQNGVTQHVSMWNSCLVPYMNEYFSASPIILELGSWEGLSACYWLSCIVLPWKGQLICVDHFQDHPTATGQERLRKFHANVEKCGGQEQTTLYDDFTVSALMKLLKNKQQWALVYVDASHRADDTLLDAMLAWKGLQKNGLMVFDDYEWYDQPHSSDEHPKRGIDAFLSVHKEQLEIFHQGYQMIVRKLVEPRFNF